MNQKSTASARAKGGGEARPRQLYDTTVVCDEYDRYTFGKIKERAPRLKDLEVSGGEKLKTFPGLLQDCFSSLYKLEPELRSAEQVRASHRPHHRLMEQVMATEEFNGLRSYTTLQEFEAAMASEVIGVAALAFFSEQQKQQIEQMAEQEQQCDQLGQNADGLAAAAEGAQEGADEAASSAPDGAMEARQQKLQQQADQLGAQAQAAQLSLEQAKEKLEQMVAASDEWFDDHEDETRQAARRMAEQAKEQVEETSELLSAWGDDAGELRKGDPAKAREYAERIRNSEKLKKLAKLVGRFKRLALSKAKSRAEARSVIVDVTRGRDLKSLHPAEKRRLAHPDLRRGFLKDWAAGTLLIFKKRDRQTQGKGPIIVCEDGSGSMKGDKELWAKAVSLALAEVAHHQKRGYAWIHFGARYSPKVFEVALGGRITPELMFQIAETFLDAGGTDFESPLQQAQELIEQQAFQRADVVFDTDGKCAVSNAWLEQFRAAKKQREFQVHSVLVNVGSASAGGVQEFSDTITEVTSLTTAKAGEVFEKL